MEIGDRGGGRSGQTTSRNLVKYALVIERCLWACPGVPVSLGTSAGQTIQHAGESYRKPCTVLVYL